ncbi:uncharacterized protein CANTADRAFT_5060 [Suhomyces tanzawaensis NRRL Y-17324]|uniref:Uncharacterized protein n=1 Tax=Suhomyces tanzawaensis NRRL Y-17324 TaxID=984487 RepID=A0A1E4SNI7_9ASCO|nr:uncharacterized protein CANTADRAFT_5060 [Suhomyces tanzawaensis NRRL Y-17324]ODV81090.1 hypothetical protein CANTADRAFT_5060 [Suhomyces tanzawaensis NRRL Y-17324]
MGLSDIVVPVVAFLLTILEVSLRHTLNVVGWASQTYPNAFQAILGLVLAYLAYKFIRKVIRIWLDLIVSIIKTVMFLSIAVVLGLVYLRGFSKLVNNDLPYFRTLWDSYFSQPEPLTGSGTGYWILDTIGQFTNTKLDHFMAKVKEPLQHATTTATPDFDPYGYDPSDYLRYAQDHFKASQGGGLFDNLAAYLNEL